MNKRNRWVDVTDPEGVELLGREADICARFMLIDHAEALYKGPGHTAENAACSTLFHACDYLRDRIGYEMEPHLKGMIKLPAEVANG